MSKLSEKFERLWHEVKGPPLMPEYRFCHRKFRLDYAYLPSLYAIEIHGGVWVGGRHTSGLGFVRDCEKTRWANYCGWTIFPLSTSDIKYDVVRELAHFFSSHFRSQTISWIDGREPKGGNQDGIHTSGNASKPKPINSRKRVGKALQGHCP